MSHRYLAHFVSDLRAAQADLSMKRILYFYSDPAMVKRAEREVCRALDILWLIQQAARMP